MSSNKVNVRELYPEIEPYETGMLKVSDVHSLYYEEVGNLHGNPIVFLHGGPGSGTTPQMRRFFDPQAYRIILFDQRGAGRSIPNACLEQNTTWHLVDDLEKLREHLNIDKWIVFGGSWGSTLALASAETYPQRVKALILRGIFCCRRKELLCFYQEGASMIFPDVWQQFIESIPICERGDLISAYYRRLTSSNEDERLRAATTWTTWELSTSRLFIDQSHVARAIQDPKYALTFARIESHYFVHGAFLDQDEQLIKNASKLKDIPGVIIQGRYDVVCPARTAWYLHKVWPQAQFHWVDDAGHSYKETGITHQLIMATDQFKHL